jgi:hypothetical protein
VKRVEYDQHICNAPKVPRTGNSRFAGSQHERTSMSKYNIRAMDRLIVPFQEKEQCGGLFMSVVQSSTTDHLSITTFSIHSSLEYIHINRYCSLEPRAQSLDRDHPNQLYLSLIHKKCFYTCIFMNTRYDNSSPLPLPHALPT